MEASRSRRLILSIQAFVKLQHQRHFKLSAAGAFCYKDPGDELIGSCKNHSTSAELFFGINDDVKHTHERKTLLYNH